jgi:hypothetical protein
VNELYEYLCEQLGEHLDKRRVLVFYDPRSEFARFFDRELANAGAGPEGLYVTFLGERKTLVARYEGSYFAVRAAVEPVVEADAPEPLLVYVPGEARELRESVLKELELGGTTYEPQLRKHARTLLKRRFTDGVIDDMLRSDNLSYDDVVAYLEPAQGGEPPSPLRAIFGGAAGEVLLTMWLARDDKDGEIAEKGATEELFRLVASRFGLAVPADASLGDARTRTARYVLVNEFRDDLHGDPPDSIGLIEAPSTKDELARLRDVANSLRQREPERYVELADQVQADLKLAQAAIEASSFGGTDTFRFEERRLLEHAIELTKTREYDAAIELASERAHSFWLDRDVARQAQWGACRLAAELGREVERVDAELAKAPASAAAWVMSYADGWFEVDRLQRRLGAWVGKMDEEPEAERAITVVLLAYDELLKRMAAGFTDALQQAGWSVPEVLSQTRVYPEVVHTIGGQVAYFLVDAFRFGMGADLRDQLQGAEELSLQPALATLPTITPIGMAALLPGASADFSVVEHRGGVAARVEQTVMPGLAERMKFLKAKVPDFVDLTLDKVLSTGTATLGKSVGDASLILVRSQEIDFAGELDTGGLARHVMDSVIGNIARAARKLASVGVESFVVTADHGHLFGERREEDMRIDVPGGQRVGLHRRCWIGRGGSTPGGTIRVSGAELGYDTDLDFVFPTGMGVFKAGGGLMYHHGGTSLQELVIPVLSFRIRGGEPQAPVDAIRLEGLPDAITNRAFSVNLTLAVLTTEPETFRVVLLANGEQVGEAGMTVGAELDRDSGIVTMQPGTEASVGVMLTREDCASVRVVVQDPATDAVLGQSDEIPVRLGI